MTRRVIGAVATACLGGALLAACSSPSSPSASPSTTSTGRSSSTAPGTSGTPPTTGTTMASGPQRCPASALTASVYGSTGAAGTIELTVMLKNSSGQSCTLDGYPGLQMIASDGSNLPTTVIRKGSYGFTSMAPAAVTVGAGQSVYVNLGYSDVPTGGETTCRIATDLEITPPNATDHVTIPARLAPCNNGTIAVSPVFAATGSAGQTMAPAA